MYKVIDNKMCYCAFDNLIINQLEYCLCTFTIYRILCMLILTEIFGISYITCGCRLVEVQINEWETYSHFIKAAFYSSRTQSPTPVFNITTDNAYKFFYINCKFVTREYGDTERSSTYQNVQFFLWSLTKALVRWNETAL